MIAFNHGITSFAARRPWQIFATVLLAGLVSEEVVMAQADLPFAGSDVVTIVSDAGKDVQLGGRIEDIQGEILTLRRSGNAGIELYRMDTVTSLVFSKPVDWDTGLAQLESKQYRRALEYFDKALRTESRPWAWNELQASAARLCLQIGQREEAVIRIERIFAKDKRTRHVCLLPLVWDSQLPDDERIHAPEDGLNDESIIRQLIACSALLHQPETQAQVEATLNRIRRTSSLSRINELAEAQLWRLCLHGDGTRLPLLQHWRDVVQQMPADSRGGPAYVLGQLQAKAHQYDDAALSLLWMPLMQPTDPALAAASLAKAIDNLIKAGRSQEAETMQLDLVQRFPQTSAARKLQTSNSPDLQPPSP